jgi:hypothetical protein
MRRKGADAPIPQREFCLEGIMASVTFRFDFYFTSRSYAVNSGRFGREKSE